MSIFAIAFSPDGRILASGDDKGNVFLWDATSGVRIAELRGHDGSVYELAFSQDSTKLASVGRDETLMLWQLGPADLAGMACTTANRNLTQEEWARFVEGYEYEATCPELASPP